MRKIIAVVLILLLTVTMFGACGEKAPTVNELLLLGEKYLTELDYEQALATFNKVIEIEPKNARGYTGAAEAYIGLDQLDEANTVLLQGLEFVEDEQGLESIRVLLEKVDAEIEEREASKAAEKEAAEQEVRDAEKAKEKEKLEAEEKEAKELAEKEAAELAEKEASEKEAAEKEAAELAEKELNEKDESEQETEKVPTANTGVKANNLTPLLGKMIKDVRNQFGSHGELSQGMYNDAEFYIASSFESGQVLIVYGKADGSYMTQTELKNYSDGVVSTLDDLKVMSIKLTGSAINNVITNGESITKEGLAAILGTPTVYSEMLYGYSHNGIHYEAWFGIEGELNELHLFY